MARKALARYFVVPVVVAIPCLLVGAATIWPYIMYDWRWPYVWGVWLLLLGSTIGWVIAESGEDAAKQETIGGWKSAEALAEALVQSEAARAEVLEQLGLLQMQLLTVLQHLHDVVEREIAKTGEGVRAVKYYEPDGEPHVVLNAGTDVQITRGLVFQLLLRPGSVSHGEPTELPCATVQVIHVQEKQCHALLVEHDPTHEVWAASHRELLRGEGSLVTLSRISARLLCPTEQSAPYHSVADGEPKLTEEVQ